MKSFGRTITTVGTQGMTATVVLAGLRPQGIDPQWSHTLAQPAL
jgi:hypothetical protein